MTYNEFIAKYGIKSEKRLVFFRPDTEEWASDAKHFMYKYSIGRKSVKGFYTQGSGIKHLAKDEDILNALQLDTLSIHNGYNMSEWFSEFGYDEDSIKAHKIYRACLDEYKQLVDMLSPEALAEFYSIESL